VGKCFPTIGIAIAKFSDFRGFLVGVVVVEGVSPGGWRNSMEIAIYSVLVVVALYIALRLVLRNVFPPDS
jgi:hypothetical protein